MKKIRHVLGISGGKDSAALAIYMHKNYPELDIEYYTADTGKELDETYRLIENLEPYLGKKIIRISADLGGVSDPFDTALDQYKGYLPSVNSRWCTKKLKLEPFEKFVGDDPVVSYVGIRGDENREGYISRKVNIQSIFPFRKNIWSEDVIQRALSNDKKRELISHFESLGIKDEHGRFSEELSKPISLNFPLQKKLNKLLDISVKDFNKIIFAYLSGTDYPLAKETHFPLLNDENVLVKDDIFLLLEESGVGVPGYYQQIEFSVDGSKGSYARSRSGCYFCFYQQKIEWVWLYEQHPDLYKEAIEYEKEGYTWIQGESLIELCQPKRVESIKREYLKRQEKNTVKNSVRLIDILDSEGEGCASCFI